MYTYMYIYICIHISLRDLYTYISIYTAQGNPCVMDHEAIEEEGAKTGVSTQRRERSGVKSHCNAVCKSQ